MSNLKQMKSRSEMEALAADIRKDFGPQAAMMGGLQKALKTIPTGALALDYELGIGGWPIGRVVSVFGPRDIGKSSMIGLNAVRNAQTMGLNCAWIALEPFSEKWALENGIDADPDDPTKPDMLVTYPTTGEDAFAVTLKIIRSGVVDLVVFDSIGAIISAGEMDEDGKPRQGGQAGLITWFVKQAAIAADRQDVCVILLNQVRDTMGSRIPGLTHMPGGHALEHLSQIIVQLKRGKGKYTVKEAGTDVQIGGEIIAHILRNKEAQGTGKKASFDYFYMETEDYPFGIDHFNDIINTAIRTGVIKKAGSYYELPNGKRLHGTKLVAEYLDANPLEVGEVREKVLEAMLNRNAKTTLEVVEDDDRAVS